MAGALLDQVLQAIVRETVGVDRQGLVEHCKVLGARTLCDAYRFGKRDEWGRTVSFAQGYCAVKMRPRHIGACFAGHFVADQEGL